MKNEMKKPNKEKEKIPSKSSDSQEILEILRNGRTQRIIKIKKRNKKYCYNKKYENIKLNNKYNREKGTKW